MIPDLDERSCVDSEIFKISIAGKAKPSYAAMATLEGFKSPESTVLLASGSSEVALGVLKSNIATKSNENNNVGVEQLEYLDALSSPLQYPQSPTA